MEFYIFLHAKLYFKKPKLRKRVEIFDVFSLTQKMIGKGKSFKKQNQSVVWGNYYFFITAFDVTIKLRKVNCRCKSYFFVTLANDLLQKDKNC